MKAYNVKGTHLDDLFEGVPSELALDLDIGQSCGMTERYHEMNKTEDSVSQDFSPFSIYSQD